MKSSSAITRCSLLLLLLPLFGCGAVLNPYHENFNCQARDDSGRCIDTPAAYDEAVGNRQAAKGKEAASRRQVDEARFARLAELLKEPRTPMIAPPQIVRVLILPYKGDGDLFMSRYAYLQVEPAKWVLTGIDEDSLPK